MNIKFLYNMKANRVTELFGIEYPVIAGGMVWCSGWRLAAAVSNAGGLGLLTWYKVQTIAALKMYSSAPYVPIFHSSPL